MEKFDALVDLLKILNKFRMVERVQTATGLDRLENDVEHSYNLAIYAWYVLCLYNLDLDIGKVLKYCLVHDFVEVYAGDTYFLVNSEEQKDKWEREKKALERLSEELIVFPDFIQTIKDYENRIDKESTFVYSLDKTIDPLQFYIEGGSLLKKMKLGFEEAAEIKNRKINNEYPAQEIYSGFMSRIKKEGILKFFYKE